MIHDSETYIAYLKARDLTETLLELYFLKTHGKNPEYTLEKVQRQIDELNRAIKWLS